MPMTYTKFLSLLMFNRVYNSETISFLLGKDKASRYRQKALRNGHIRKAVVSKRERTVHATTLYFLTKRGLAYLIDHDNLITQAMTLDEVEPFVSSLRRDDRKIERKEKIAKDTAVLTFASQAGAAVPYENFKISIHELSSAEGDEPDPETSIDDYVRSVLTEEAYLSFGLFPKTDRAADIIFHNNIYIKANSGEANSYVGSRDYLGGRYGGVVDSKFKSIFIYAHPMFGMRWSYWINEREMAAYRIWRKTQNKNAENNSLKRSGTCAALLVSSPKDFANLYFDIDNSRKTKDEVFGGNYDHFYIFPFDEHGTEQMKWLMHVNDDEFNAQMTQDAVDSGLFTKNTGSNYALFPLLNESGERTALGFQLDAKKLEHIERLAQLNETETFEILCFRWQAPYYKAIVPENVKATTIKFS